MIRNEHDMLAEALRNHSCFCQTIFVLDGSRGDAQVATREICESFPKVAGYWHDDDTGYQQPLRDGARQFLLERAREIHGLNNWYALLHGDELWGEDPRPKLEIPDHPYAVVIQLYHFFPHSSERDSWSFPANGSIEATSKWYMLPPGREHRLFFDTGEHNYEVSLHSRTIPSTLQRHIRLPISIKQYNYRTPEQAYDRAQERRDSGWQENHYQHLLNGPEGFFIDSLAQTGHKWLGGLPPGQGQATNIRANPLPTLTCDPTEE